MAVVVVSYMQTHTVVVADHKDGQNKVLAVHKVVADHKVMAVHKGMADHTGHNPLVADHLDTWGLVGWGYPIDLLVSKDFHIGHIVGIMEHRTLEEQEVEVLASDRSNPFHDSQN